MFLNIVRDFVDINVIHICMLRNMIPTLLGEMSTTMCILEISLEVVKCFVVPQYYFLRLKGITQKRSLQGYYRDFGVESQDYGFNYKRH